MFILRSYLVRFEMQLVNVSNASLATITRCQLADIYLKIIAVIGFHWHTVCPRLLDLLLKLTTLRRERIGTPDYNEW